MPNVRKDKESIFNDRETALDPGRNGAMTPETKLRIAQVAEKISKGWTKFETVRWMENEWGIKETSQNKYWNAALATLAKSASDSEYVEEMRQKAIATLDRAIQEEIALNKHKELNTSIELMAKLMGYSQPTKMEIKADTNIKFSFGDIPAEEGDEDKE